MSVSLLMVDDCIEHLNSIHRNFKLIGLDGIVYKATNPQMALDYLKTREITHLLCDYDLGEQYQTGFELISTWRKQFTSIGRAVLFTGSPIDFIALPDGIDTVLLKGKDTDIKRICTALNLSSSK